MLGVAVLGLGHLEHDSGRRHRGLGHRGLRGAQAEGRIVDGTRHEVDEGQADVEHACLAPPADGLQAGARSRWKSRPPAVAAWKRSLGATGVPSARLARSSTSCARTEVGAPLDTMGWTRLARPPSRMVSTTQALCMRPSQVLSEAARAQAPSPGRSPRGTRTVRASCRSGALSPLARRAATASALSASSAMASVAALCSKGNDTYRPPVAAGGRTLQASQVASNAA